MARHTKRCPSLAIFRAGVSAAVASIALFPVTLIGCAPIDAATAFATRSPGTFLIAGLGIVAEISASGTHHNGWMSGAFHTDIQWRIWHLLSGGCGLFRCLRRLLYRSFLCRFLGGRLLRRLLHRSGLRRRFLRRLWCRLLRRRFLRPRFFKAATMLPCQPHSACVSV